MTQFGFLTSELLTRDYTETYYREDGTRVTAAPTHIVRPGSASQNPVCARGGGSLLTELLVSPQDRCYYQGRVEQHRHSAVSISTCDGLR